MSTSKEVSKVWMDELFKDSRIQAFTSKVYDYTVFDKQESMSDLAKLLCNNEVNFVQYFVQRYRDEAVLGRCGDLKFRVNVEYFLEEECEGAPNVIQEFFEVLDQVYTEKLQYTWKGTVSTSNNNKAFPQVRRSRPINQRSVFVGSYFYTADKNL